MIIIHHHSKRNQRVLRCQVVRRPPARKAKEVDRRNGKGIPRFTAGAVEGSQDFFHSSSSHDYTWFLWDEYDYVYHPMII